ncbi:MAG: hypothetical protein Q9179_005183 [Wetmoreana sp. 5 TL-2023]
MPPKHTPSKEAAPASSPTTRQIPSDISCLILYEPLEPNYEKQPIRKGMNGGNRYWAPPNRKNAYHRNNTRAELFRWIGGRVQVPAANDVSRQRKLDAYQYAVATVFTQFPDTDHLLAVPFHAETRNVDEVYGGWKVLSFNHVQHGTNRTLSQVDLAGDQARLAAPGSGEWMPQLLPRIYDYDSNLTPDRTTSAGLVGSLPILFALPAFSARQDELSQVLRTCLRPNKWLPHPHNHGHFQGRGMVVTVYRDPANPKGSTKANLDRLQDGYFGPFYQP